MHLIKYQSIKVFLSCFVFLLLSSCVSTNSNQAIEPENTLSSQLSYKQLSTVLNLVANWQIQHWEENRKTLTRHKSHWNERGWVFGSLYPGMHAWSSYSGNQAYLDHLLKVAQRNKWRLGKREYNADDYVVGANYLSLYEALGSTDTSMITPLIKRFDSIIKKPAQNSLWFPTRIQRKNGAERCTNRWCWCDAVFMGPPTFFYLSKVTGDMKYANFADNEFWKTTAYLYDKKAQLFYRDSRFFKAKDEQGNKIFWSRGNGWVLAGIAQMLNHMPKDFPTRARYELLFKIMSQKIVSLVRADGYWPTSLLNESHPNSKETSGTGFYVYALSWGINNALLDRETYQPIVAKGWQALVSSIYKDGRVGWVQTIGYEPKFTQPRETQLYGAGALLLAGTEIIKMIEGNQVH